MTERGSERMIPLPPSTASPHLECLCVSVWQSPFVHHQTVTASKRFTVTPSLHPGPAVWSSYPSNLLCFILTCCCGVTCPGRVSQERRIKYKVTRTGWWRERQRYPWPDSNSVSMKLVPQALRRSVRWCAGRFFRFLHSFSRQNMERVCSVECSLLSCSLTTMFFFSYHKWLAFSLFLWGTFACYFQLFKASRELQRTNRVQNKSSCFVPLSPSTTTLVVL